MNSFFKPWAIAMALRAPRLLMLVWWIALFRFIAVECWERAAAEAASLWREAMREKEIMTLKVQYVRAIARVAKDAERVDPT